MIELPNVITAKKYENNFTLQVVAYRKATDIEMFQALRKYMIQHRLKHLPKNKIVTVIANYGAIDL